MGSPTHSQTQLEILSLPISLGYSSSEAGTPQRIHCRYSNRTNQCLTHLDILLVKHGLTNAFTEKSSNPSYAHLSLGCSSSEAGTQQRKHCRYSNRTNQCLTHLDILLVKHGLTNTFTEKSRNPSYSHLSLRYSSSEAGTHQRIHCRYSNRTDQCLTHLDILLVKHGLTNAFTEKSSNPSYAHLSLGCSSSEAGTQQRKHCRYSNRTNQCLTHLDILLVKHGLTNTFTEKSRNPSYSHLSLRYSSSEAGTHQRIHCRYSNGTNQCLTHLDILLVKHGLTNAFTEKSRHPSYAHLSLGCSSSAAGTHQRIHCRYSNRTNQCLTHLDILLVKHGLTNAFTEKSRNPSYSHLSLGYSSSEAGTHQRIHCRYSNRTDACMMHLDILLVKHGLTNALTEKSRNPSYSHLSLGYSSSEAGTQQRIHRRYSNRTNQCLTHLDILLVKH